MSTRPSGPPINPFPPEPKIPCVEEQQQPTAEDLDAAVEQVRSDPLAGPNVEDL